METLTFSLHAALPHLEIYKDTDGTIRARIGFDWADSFDGALFNEDTTEWETAPSGSIERRLGEAACLLRFPDEIELGSVPKAYIVPSKDGTWEQAALKRKDAEEKATQEWYTGEVIEFDPQEIEG